MSWFQDSLMARRAVAKGEARSEHAITEEPKASIIMSTAPSLSRF